VHFILKFYSYFEFCIFGVGSYDCWSSVSVVYCTSQLVELFTAKPVGTWPDCCNVEMTFLRQKFLLAAHCSTLVPVSVDPLMNGQMGGGGLIMLVARYFQIIYIYIYIKRMPVLLHIKKKVEPVMVTYSV
jgi:hypothetical protein